MSFPLIFLKTTRKIAPREAADLSGARFTPCSLCLQLLDARGGGACAPAPGLLPSLLPFALGQWRFHDPTDELSYPKLRKAAPTNLVGELPAPAVGWESSEELGGFAALPLEAAASSPWGCGAGAVSGAAGTERAPAAVCACACVSAYVCACAGVTAPCAVLSASSAW